MAQRITERLRLASIEITQRCNRHCDYCEQPRSDREMPMTQFADSLDALKVEGVEAVALGGGEPTLHSALPELLVLARARALRAGLTTNARAPEQVRSLADAGWMESFGVSAGKGGWKDLANHPHAVVNLLLTRGKQAQVIRWGAEAIQLGSRSLLLLGYKGNLADFMPSNDELTNIFRLLTLLARRSGAAFAADDYVRRRLGLTQSCGEGFVRVRIDGSRDPCCFSSCEYRILSHQLRADKGRS